jgi:hypothetical protein
LKNPQELHLMPNSFSGAGENLLFYHFNLENYFQYYFLTRLWIPKTQSLRDRAETLPR